MYITYFILIWFSKARDFVYLPYVACIWVWHCILDVSYNERICPHQQSQVSGRKWVKTRAENKMGVFPCCDRWSANCPVLKRRRWLCKESGRNISGGGQFVWRSRIWAQHWVSQRKGRGDGHGGDKSEGSERRKHLLSSRWSPQEWGQELEWGGTLWIGNGNQEAERWHQQGQGGSGTISPTDLGVTAASEEDISPTCPEAPGAGAGEQPACGDLPEGGLLARPPCCHQGKHPWEETEDSGCSWGHGKSLGARRVVRGQLR